MVPKRIGLVGFDGVTSLDLVGPADAFKAAALDNGYGGRIACYEVCLVGATSKRFRAESGLDFTAQETLASAPELDTIIVAGGSGIPPVTDAIARGLVERAGETRRFGSICSGIFPLAESGLVTGREVTTHWRFTRELAQRYPDLRVNHKLALIRDGRYVTSNGLNGGLNLALAMVEEDYGPFVAQSVARELRIVFSEPRERTAETSVGLEHPRERFADLVGWIIRNLHQDLSVEILARRACMCPSHFSKAFKSMFGEPPTVFVENLRLNEARRRLSKRQKTVRSVAASVGFANPTTFRRAFERRFGNRPTDCLEWTRRVPAERTDEPSATVPEEAHAPACA